MPNPIVHALGAAAMLLAFAYCPASAAQTAKLNSDGSIDLVGQRLKCGTVRLRLDRRLPNLGAASPTDRVLLINPMLLAAEDKTVQLFVFHHECGHIHVGASELDADCWAVGQGYAAGWLDRRNLKAVCQSFGGAPETSTHPSAKRRCANLDRCFAAAEAKRQVPGGAPAQTAGASTLPPASATTATVASYRVAKADAPRLVQEPRLVRTGWLR